MTNLIQFFLPKSFRLTFMYFSIGLGFCILLHFVPIDDEIKETIRVLVMSLAFPGIAYFNSRSYINSSLHWLLLAPVHKLSIIAVNGLNNLSKIISILVLHSLFNVLESKVYGTTNGEFFSWGDSSWDASSFLFCSLIIVVMTVFLFGILPSVTDRVQNARDYKVTRSLFKNKNFIQTFAILGICCFIAINYGEKLAPYLSEFLFQPFAICLLLAIGTVLTLQSVKYYFPSNRVIIIVGILFVLTSIITYFQAKSDITNPNIPITVRMESLDLIIPYDGNLKAQMIEELKQHVPAHRALRGNEFSGVFGHEETAESKELSAIYIKRCDEFRDYNCRFAHYLPESYKISGLTKKIKESCVNDVGSCVLIYKRRDTTKSEGLDLRKIITEKCANPELPDRVICSEFSSYTLKGKK